jgi:hypothetical protein
VKRRKWNKINVIKSIEEEKCIFISCEEVRTTYNVCFEDNFGYKYSMKFQDFLKGRRLPFGKANKYTLENISLWIKIKKSSFVLCEENVYKGCNSKLKLKCFKCKNFFYTTWDSIKAGQGCGVCCGKQIIKENSLYFLRPDLMKEWSKKNTINPKEISLYSFKKCIWKCKFGHEWERSPSGRVSNNSGYPFCSGRFSTKENNFSVKFPHLLAEWNYKKNGNPEDYPPYSNKVVSWICSTCGNNWNTKLEKRSYGNNCPKCKSSKGEKKIYSYLSHHNIDFFTEYRFKDCRNSLPLPFDFYIPSHNMCIEYQGEHHYKPISSRGGEKKLDYILDNDKIKRKYCKKNKITLVVIPYWKFDKIEKIIEGRFL